MGLETLKELGLTESEIKVYSSLLEIGQSTTGPIIKKAKISSSKIYEILDKLTRKGLVSYVLKGSIKNFQATEPERILDLLREREQEIEKQRGEIERILPELTRKRELSKIKESAAIYRGMKGLHNVFYDSLDLMKKGEIQYVTGIPSRSEKANRFFIKWDKDRAKRGVKTKRLFNENAKGELQTLPENNPLSEIKYMPEGIVTLAAINIFNNRTVIFPETIHEPLLIVIDNKEIADSFKTQFELLWNQQSIIINGNKGPEFVLKDILKTLKTGDVDMVFGLDESKLNSYPEGNNSVIKFYKAMEERKIKEKIILRIGTKFPTTSISERKYLPKEYFGPIHYEIYANKIAMINWDKPITTIITENKAMADSFRIYFNNLWKIAKQ